MCNIKQANERLFCITLILTKGSQYGVPTKKWAQHGGHRPPCCMDILCRKLIHRHGQLAKGIFNIPLYHTVARQRKSGA